MRAAGLLLVLALVLAGCGGGGGKKESAWVTDAVKWEANLVSSAVEPVMRTPPVKALGGKSPTPSAKAQKVATRAMRSCWKTFQAQVGEAPSEATAAMALTARTMCGKFQQAAPLLAKNLRDPRGTRLWNAGVKLAGTLSDQLRTATQS
jgi:hypothetical protein